MGDTHDSQAAELLKVFVVIFVQSLHSVQIIIGAKFLLQCCSILVLTPLTATLLTSP